MLWGMFLRNRPLIRRHFVCRPYRLVLADTRQRRCTSPRGTALRAGGRVWDHLPHTRLTCTDCCHRSRHTRRCHRLERCHRTGEMRPTRRPREYASFAHRRTTKQMKSAKWHIKFHSTMPYIYMCVCICILLVFLYCPAVRWRCRTRASTWAKLSSIGTTPTLLGHAALHSRVAVPIHEMQTAAEDTPFSVAD